MKEERSLTPHFFMPFDEYLMNYLTLRGLIIDLNYKYIIAGYKYKITIIARFGFLQF